MSSVSRHSLALLFILVSVLGFAVEASAYVSPVVYDLSGFYREGEDVTVWNDCGEGFSGWNVGYYLDRNPPAFSYGTSGGNDPTVAAANTQIITGVDNHDTMGPCAYVEAGYTRSVGILVAGWHTIHFVFWAMLNGGGAISTPTLFGYISKSFEVCVASAHTGCESTPNSCGDKNYGVVNCQGTCVDGNGWTLSTPDERPQNAWDPTCTGYTTPTGSPGYISPQCVANAYTYCQSVTTNSCGDPIPGYVNCDGTCVDMNGLPMGTPVERSGWNQPCSTPANNCGQKVSGTTDCDGVCSAGYLPIPETTPTGAIYNEACSRESIPNACGGTAVNSGTIQCNGYCSVGTPASPPPPSYYNQPCNTYPNACGQTASGTLDCNAMCSVGYTPPPETTLTGATYNALCSLNICGLGYDGAIGCSGICDQYLTLTGSASPATEVAAPPRATITAPTSDQLVLDGTSVTYSGTGTADTSLGANSITGYEWRDGSCTTGTLVSTAASFSQVFSTGTHRIYLRVKDSNNTWSTNCPSWKTIESLRQPPVGKIMRPAPNVAGWTVPYPTEVTFQRGGMGTAIDERFGSNNIISWEWREGSCSSGPPIPPANAFDSAFGWYTASYSTPGIHYVYLREQDSYGLWSDCDIRVVTVVDGTVPPVNAVCGATPYECTAGELGGRDGDSSYSGTGWSWDCQGLNGGTSTSGYACRLPYPTPTVSLTASPTSVPYGGQAELSWSSTNLPWGIDNQSSCTASSGNWSIPSSVSWTYRGALSGNVLTPPLTADTTFTLQCTGTGGQSSPQSVTVTVAVPPISASYQVSPVSGFINDLFTWNVWGVSGGAGFPYSFSWSGDESLSGTGKTVAKTYTSIGTKTGTVTVTSGSLSQPFSCPVNVSAQPDLTADAPVISLSTSGTSIIGTLSATTTNSGVGSTNIGFTNLFQRADTYNSSDGVATNILDIGTRNSTTLAGNTSTSTTLSYTFLSSDANTTRYIRVCADKNAAGNTGVITESDENNNCGAWASIFVYPVLTATCTMTSTGPPTGFTGNYTSREYTYTVSASGGGGAGSYTYSAWSGTDGLTGSAPSTTKKYTTGGTKTAAITVTSAEFQKVATCSINVQPIADLIVTPP